MTSTTTTTANVDRKWFGGSLSKLAGSIIHECNRYDESFRTIHASEGVRYSNKRKAVFIESDHTSNVYAFFARLCRDGLSVQHGLFPANLPATTWIELSGCLMAQKSLFLRSVSVRSCDIPSGPRTVGGRSYSGLHTTVHGPRCLSPGASPDPPQPRVLASPPRWHICICMCIHNMRLGRVRARWGAPTQHYSHRMQRTH